MIKVPQQQIPGVYHRRVGDIAVTAISDGFLDGTLDVLRNITQEGARQILAESFRPARRTAVNAFPVYSGGRLGLVDTGSGSYLQPTAGKAMANIKAAGVDPADIEAVLLTHMHPDHSAGLIDLATGRRNFPNAELIVHENEPRHWFDDAKMAVATERVRKLYFQCAREQTAPYRDRLRLFREGEVFPGVTAIPRHGHTPGHDVHDQLRQRATPHLGRYRARAGGANRTARGVHGVRHRCRCRGRFAAQGIRHGRHGAPARYRYAPAFSRIRTSRAPRRWLPADTCRLGAVPIMESKFT